MLALAVIATFIASSSVALSTGSYVDMIYVCPNEDVVLQCVVEPSASTIVWNITSPVSKCTKARISLTANPSNCSNVTEECGPFIAQSWKNTSEVCTDSSLRVKATPEVNGTTIQCMGGGQFQEVLIASYQLIVLGLPNVVIVPSHMVSSIAFQLEGSSYSGLKGSISGANQTFDITGSAAQLVIFGGLMHDTRYVFKLALSNCVDRQTIQSFSLRTLAPPPKAIKTVAVFNHYSNVQHIELQWDHLGGNISQYFITIVTRAGTICGRRIIPCAALICTDILKVNLTDISYIIFLSSVNEAGVGPALNVTIDTSNLIIEDVMQRWNPNATDISCRFQNHQSFYCMVCCSTDPSVSPDSSVYNISNTRGTEVTVSLQGLTSGQMYYCKAAATNTNSNNCAGPVVGGVKVLFSLDMKAGSLQATQSPSSVNIPFWVAIVLAVSLVVIILVTVIPLLTLCFLCWGRRSQTLALQVFPAHSGSRNVTEAPPGTVCGEKSCASLSPTEQWPGNRKHLIHSQGPVPGTGLAPGSGLIAGPVYETIVQRRSSSADIGVAYSVQAVPHTKPEEKQMEHSYAVLERMDERRSMAEESVENEAIRDTICRETPSNHCYAVLERPTPLFESDPLGRGTELRGEN